METTRLPPPSTDTEERILEAALEVFARKGRDGARMQEIADSAEINRALLHYYFRSKQQLYETVFARGFRQFVTSLAPAMQAGAGFADTLAAFVTGYVDYIRDHQDMARLMLNENVAGGSLLGRHLEAAFESPDATPQRLMERKITEAIAAGEIRAVDPRHTLLTVVSACLFFFVALPTVRYLNPEARDDFDGFVESRKAHVIDLLLHGLLPREEGVK